MGCVITRRGWRKSGVAARMPIARAGKAAQDELLLLIARGEIGMKIAIQGERGAFSHEALRRMLPNAQVLACATSKDVFDAVERRRASGAVIPIENTLAG